MFHECYSNEINDIKVPQRSPSVTMASASETVPARQPGPSKIMASAAIRLFKVNQAGGYDAVENGGALGCVVMGTGVAYQLLVYNAQVS